PARRFIRHTADVPIEIRTVPGRPTRSQPALNVSEGGLSFISEDEIGLGSTIDIRIEHVSPAFEARAKVVWTREEGDAWCIGVQFLDANDAYRARMVEQICTIDRYMKQVQEEEGRALTRDEAAREWI